MSMTATQAQQLYVAYFNRPADTLGLAYWTGKPAAQASAAFSTSAEYVATYAGMSNAQIVNAIYTNLFGRPANDLAGLTFWANHLTNGTLSVSNVVTAIAAAAQGTDLVAYNNKVTAAAAFTAALDTAAEVIAYSGTTANNAAKAWLSGVTTDATLTTATTTAALNASIATVVTVGGPAGSTFALTTGVDTFTGTSGNDTFNADNTGAAVVLSSADVLNGGSGDDTLNVYSTGNAFNLPTLTSIETLNVYDQNANQSIAAANFASVTTANLIRGDGALTLTGGANLATVGVSDVVAATGGVVLAFEAARTSATINLNGVTAAGGAADENVDVNGAALTTVTVNTTGTASSFDVLDVASATTIAINAAVGLTATSLETGATSSALTITGAGAVSLGTLDTAINTVTASTATGALTAAIGGETDTVVTLGSGNDVITAGTTDALVAANALAVNAGAGTGDVLVVVETVDVDTAADAARYTNFEVIRSGDSVDMSLVAGIVALQVAAATNETFSNISATQAGAVTLRGSQTTNVTFGLTGATTVGNIDTLALSINDGSSTVNTITAANITAAGVENVTIAATDHFTATVLTGLTAMTNMTVTGAGNVSLTTGALALNTNTTINASAVTGTVLINAIDATTNGALITGSATKANTITGTVSADVIVGGTGIDTVTNFGAGADTLNFAVDTAADIFVIAALTGRTTITNFDAATTTTTEDLVNVSADTVDGAEVQITAAAAQGAIGSDRTIVIEQTVGAAGQLTTGGTATLATADFTAATLTNVAAYLSERFTGDNDTNADETALIVLNNGTNTYLYAYADSTTANTTIDAGEIVLVGVINSAVLNTGDIYQTV